MRKIILAILAVSLACGATIRTWDHGASSNSWKAAANWSDDALPGATDTALFNGTDTAGCTMDSTVTIGAFIIRAAYTKIFNDGGYSPTVAGICSVGTGGTFTASGHWTQTGNADFLLTNFGTYSVASMRIEVQGTGNLSIGKAATVADSLIKSGTSKKTTWTNTIGAASGFRYLSIASGDTLTLAGPMTINNPIILTPLSNSGVINGVNKIEFFFDNASLDTIDLPKIRLTGTGGSHYVSVKKNTGAGALIVNWTDSIINQGTNSGGYFTYNQSTSSSGTLTFNTNNYPLVAGSNAGLTLHNANANSSATFNLGSSNLTYNQWTAGTVLGTTTINWGTSTHNLVGALSPAILAKSTFTYTNASTAQINLVSTSSTAVGIKCATLVHPPMTINTARNIAYCYFLSDSLYTSNFTITDGGFNTAGKSMFLSGNFTRQATANDTIAALTTAHQWNFSGASPTLTLQGTGPRRIDSAQWVPQHSLYIVMDSNNTIKSFSPVRDTAPQVWTMQASRTLTVLAAADSSWSGAATRYDTLRSSTPGGAATIAIPNVKRDSYLYVKDVTLTGYADTCTYCTNGGGNTGWVFPAICSTTTLIRAPTQTATRNVAITPMVHSWTGATPDSIKVRTALPAGLSAHPATGTISGTPTDTSSMTGYRVVGYACSDSSVVYDSLRVRGVIPVLSTLKHPMGRIGYVDTCLGSGFGTSGGTASLGGTSVTITRQVDDTLIWTVPTKAKGTYNWIYTAPFGEKDTVSFRVLVPSIIVTNP